MITVYHSGPPGIVALDPSKIRRLGDFGPGIYFSTINALEYLYGNTLYAAEIDPKHPMVLSSEIIPDGELRRIYKAFNLTDEDTQFFEDEVHPLVGLFALLEFVYSSKQVARVLTHLGYDSILVMNEIINARLPASISKRPAGDYWAIFDMSIVASFGPVRSNASMSGWRGSRR